MTSPQFRMRLADPQDQNDPRFQTCHDPTHVLERDGEKVGHCTAHVGVKALEIPSFETISDVRLRGNGRRFLEELEILAKDEGKKFMCAVDLNDVTEPFWAHMGFTMRRVLPNDKVVRCRRI